MMSKEPKSYSYWEVERQTKVKPTLKTLKWACSANFNCIYWNFYIFYFQNFVSKRFLSQPPFGFGSAILLIAQ